MDEQLDDFQLSEDTSVIKQKRPNFLLVLCILTFIASGLGVIMGLVSLAGVGDIEDTLRNANMSRDPFSQSFLEGIDIEAMRQTQNMVNILSLVASVLCLAGALIMFKLRKIGFVPYVLGHAAAIYGTFLNIALVEQISEAFPVDFMGDMMSMAGGAGMIFTVIIAIAFIIMYGLNLKHLK